MKVLYYCDWFEEYTANLAIAVASESAEVTLIARESSREFDNRRMDEESVHRELLANKVHLFLLPGKYYSIKSLIALHRIYRVKRKAGYDCFHLQQTGDPRFLWIALRMPTVLTLHEPAARHGVVSAADRLRQFTGGIALSAYRRIADLIVVHTMGSWSGLTPSERLKAHVIAHGVSPRPAHPVGDSKKVLFFGRAAAYKGIETLLGAMRQVWAVVPSARLRILASPGDFAPVPTPDPRIDATWDGYSNEQLDLELADARLVCLPYTSASGSGVGAQAYGAGKPIVATDLEGLRELVARKELLARPGDEDDLARALTTALRDDYGPQEIDPTRAWSGVGAAHILIYQLLTPAPNRGRF